MASLRPGDTGLRVGEGAEGAPGFPIASFLLSCGGAKQTVFWGAGAPGNAPLSRERFLLGFPGAAIYPPLSRRSPDVGIFHCYQSEVRRST